MGVAEFVRALAFLKSHDFSYPKTEGRQSLASVNRFALAECRLSLGERTFFRSAKDDMRDRDC